METQGIGNGLFEFKQQDSLTRQKNEVSGARIWEKVGRVLGGHIIYEAACWHSGKTARNIQSINMLLKAGLLGEKSPYDEGTQLLIIETIRGINELNIAWMQR
jgi:hypothetical protein